MTRIRPYILFAFFALAVSIGAFLPLSNVAAHGALSIKDGMAVVVGDAVAVYFKLGNTGHEDRLIGVRSPVAETASLHGTNAEGNQDQMIPLDDIEIPFLGDVAFVPGGYHVMLEGVQQPMQSGAKIPITLIFEDNDPMTFVVPLHMAGEQD